MRPKYQRIESFFFFFFFSFFRGKIFQFCTTVRFRGLDGVGRTESVQVRLVNKWKWVEGWREGGVKLDKNGKVHFA